MLMKIFFVLFLVIQTSLQDSCRFESETGTLELSKLATFSTFQSYQHFDEITKNSSIVTYFFHPCNDTKTPVETTGCNDSFSLCKKEVNVTLNATSVIFSKPNYTILGKSSSGSFKTFNNSIYLSFEENLIQLVCTASLPLEQSNFVQTSDKNLVFYSSAACLIQHVEPSHSVGSVLLLILGIFMIIYFIGGYLFKYIMQGSRGFEAFPHYDFWTDLPALVRDGALFLSNGCRPAAETQDSYESI